MTRREQRNMRFPRHGGIYRSDAVQLKPLGRTAASRWSAPGQGKERDGRSALCSSSAMSSGRLFLDRVARQQSPSPLHRQSHHNAPPPSNGIAYHRIARVCFSGCLSSAVHPRRSLRFLGVLAAWREIVFLRWSGCDVWRARKAPGLRT